MEPLRIGIVTVSDRASRGEYEDRSGPAIREFLDGAVTSSWAAVARVVPDDRDPLAALLRELAGPRGCALILTTGGTGPAPRDVTPEATRDVCTRLLPGFGERMRATSVERLPTAMLSRGGAGVLDHTLIINLPGSPRGIVECLEALLPAVPHCLKLIGGGQLELDPSVVRRVDPGH